MLLHCTDILPFSTAISYSAVMGSVTLSVTAEIVGKHVEAAFYQVFVEAVVVIVNGHKRVIAFLATESFLVGS